MCIKHQFKILLRLTWSEMYKRRAQTLMDFYNPETDKNGMEIESIKVDLIVLTMRELPRF
jgi:hypothetical protein